MNSQVLAEFIRFYEEAQQSPSQVSLYTLIEISEVSAQATQKLLAEGNKSQFIAQLKRNNDTLDWPNWFFPVLNTPDLEACLNWVSQSPTYAVTEKDRVLTQAEVIESFKPSNEQDARPKAVFGIFLCSEGEILPVSTPVKSTSEFLAGSDALFESWHEETIREYFRFLQDNLGGLAQTESSKLKLGTS